MHRPTLLLVLACLAALALPALPAAAQSPAVAQPAVLTIDGLLIGEPFLDFFLANGGADLLGPPLTDAFVDPRSGLPAQLFAHGLLEQHGEAVLLARLGSLRAAALADTPPFRWLPPDTPLPAGARYVPESGHTLGGAFAWYHRLHGGVALLGHPISEEFWEEQPGGGPLLIQYFERDRLSYHPLPGGGGEVRREPLGRWYAENHLPAEVLIPGRPLAVLAGAAMAYRPETADGHNMALAIERLHGARIAPGATLSFLTAIGPITAEAGYLPGSAIVDGAIVDDVVGGGVCNVSTLLYRTAWSAGLPIAERRGHRIWLARYADAPGLEAAVYDPGLDLRVRNDTGEPIYVAAEARAGRVIVTLWGRGDGRQVRLLKPEILAGEQIEVRNTRQIYGADGRLLRSERVLTRYER